MLYNEARGLIQSGDIIAFTHLGWNSLSDIESQLVRMFTRSEYSHVGVAWVVADRVFVLEAVVPEIRIFPLSKCKAFYWLPMGKPLSKDAENMALLLVGQGYSKWEAIKGFFGATKPNARWQCAEYVKEVLTVNGINLSGKDTPTDVVKSAMSDYGRSLVSVLVT